MKKVHVPGLTEVQFDLCYLWLDCSSGVFMNGLFAQFISLIYGKQENE